MNYRQQTYDAERISMNIVRLKKGGETFEVVILNPDKASAMKGGDTGIDISDAVRSEHIFSDARKGLMASEPKMKELFGTSDPEAVAKVIIQDGEFHLTSEQKKEMIDKKKAQIIDYIHMNAFDPKTKLPHPKTRIELAMDSAKVNIDMHRNVASQLEDVIKKLRPILPLSFGEFRIKVTIPTRKAMQAYSKIKMNNTLKNEKWNNDGSVEFEINALAGQKEKIISLIHTLTQGEAQIEEI